ncbi:TPA: ISNCY family transposase, partial [Klebsiella pneumoniae]
RVLRKTSVLRDRTAINNGEHEVTLKIARNMPQNSIVRNTAMKMTGLTGDDLA